MSRLEGNNFQVHSVTFDVILLRKDKYQIALWQRYSNFKKLFHSYSMLRNNVSFLLAVAVYSTRCSLVLKINLFQTCTRQHFTPKCIFLDCHSMWKPQQWQAYFKHFYIIIILDDTINGQLLYGVGITSLDKGVGSINYLKILFRNVCSLANMRGDCKVKTFLVLVR